MWLSKTQVCNDAMQVYVRFQLLTKRKFHRHSLGIHPLSRQAYFVRLRANYRVAHKEGRTAASHFCHQISSFRVAGVGQSQMMTFATRESTSRYNGGEFRPEKKKIEIMACVQLSS